MDDKDLFTEEQQDDLVSGIRLGDLGDFIHRAIDEAEKITLLHLDKLMKAAIKKDIPGLIHFPVVIAIETALSLSLDGKGLSDDEKADVWLTVTRAMKDRMSERNGTQDDTDTKDTRMRF